MADDAHDERFRQHEEMLQGLARMFSAQHEMNQRVTLAIEHIDRTLAQQAEFNGGRRFRFVDLALDCHSKFIPIDKEANHQVVHAFRLGKADRAPH